MTFVLNFDKTLATTRTLVSDTDYANIKNYTTSPAQMASNITRIWVVNLTTLGVQQGGKVYYSYDNAPDVYYEIPKVSSNVARLDSFYFPSGMSATLHIGELPQPEPEPEPTTSVIEIHGATSTDIDVKMRVYRNISPPNDWYDVVSGTSYNLGTYDFYVTRRNNVLLEKVEYYIGDDSNTKQPMPLNPSGTMYVLLEHRLAGDLHIVATTTQPEPIEPPDIEFEMTAFNNAYLVTNDIIHSLSNERYNFNDGDLAEYFINVIKFPFDIPENVIGEVAKIQLGNYKMETLAPTLLSDMVKYDLGTVSIPSIYGNSKDFVNTKATLYLPYINPVELDINLVMGQSIIITLVIDMYNGDAQFSIISTKTNNVVLVETTSLGREIPFSRTQWGKGTVHQIGGYKGVLNGVTRPYIMLERQGDASQDVDEITTSELVTVCDYLYNCVGYVEVNNPNVDVKATLQEKLEINSLLQGGIYINEDY